MSNKREMLSPQGRDQLLLILEYAAKACGYSLCLRKDGAVSIDMINDWNPLTSSADCAAMCAKLKIDTTWENILVICSVPMFLNATWFEDHNNDREAAWRYAACKVAEAIGKAMK